LKGFQVAITNQTNFLELSRPRELTERVQGQRARGQANPNQRKEIARRMMATRLMKKMKMS